MEQQVFLINEWIVTIKLSFFILLIELIIKKITIVHTELNGVENTKKNSNVCIFDKRNS